MVRPSIGAWLIGARGGVASMAAVGLIALQKGLIDEVGLISGLPEFANLKSRSWSDFLIGGHEIRKVSLIDEAMRLATESRAIDPTIVQKCEAGLNRIDARVRLGTICKVGPTIAGLASDEVPKQETPREAVDRLKEDLTQFAKDNQLEHVVVVNVSSTEPPVDPNTVPKQWSELEKLLDHPEQCPLQASSLYAIATLDLGYSYINFTPSLGSSPMAIDELARLRNTRHMGCDGKTGETLMKSVLAPLFRHRNLDVMSWVGHNIFGNLDGKVLDDPANKETKVTSKDQLLGKILGHQPQTLVSIEYIKSMNDWKTAWDHIHFKGFMGTPMTLQFTWQGCDSLLAAPLVLDLIRLTVAARQRGHVGLMTFLSHFFKSPYGTEEQAFVRQFQLFENWAVSNK